MINQQKLSDIVNTKYKKYGNYRSRWKVIYTIVVVLPIVFSGVAAAILLELKSLEGWPFTKDTATILAGLSAIVASIGTKLGAEHKLRASKTAKRRTEAFKNRLDITTDIDSNQLNEINSEITRIYDDWAEEFGL